MEDKKSEDNKVSRGVWEIIETKARETRIAERKETRRERVEEERKEKKNQKKRTIEVKKIAEKWKIWNKKEKVAKFQEEVKKLVSQRFHKWIYIFKKKASEKILTKKL